MSDLPEPNRAPARSDDLSTQRLWALIVWGCFLGNFLTGFTGLIGVILAYVKRPKLKGTIYASHMVSAIRTFWIGLGAVLGGLLGPFWMFLAATTPHGSPTPAVPAFMIVLALGCVVLFLGGFVWILFRAIRGFVRALEQKPIDDPYGWI